MNRTEIEHLLGPQLTAALERKGYSQLTPVQLAVLDAGVAGRDLRISSQTGSGKTLAIGFAVRSAVTSAPEPVQSADAALAAAPRALIIEPTRELAQQTCTELRWLFADCGARVVPLTGGAAPREELRALRKEPAIIVATPGRLLDHIERGAVELAKTPVIVLDEADRLLDMGFREDLDRIFARMPKERTTHLVSATFADEVRALADRVQTNAERVQGTAPGAPNADIEHVLHLVRPSDRAHALVNLLLTLRDVPTLIFARTRAAVAELASELIGAGFRAGVLSGELDQNARNAALGAFREGRIRVLVATDVAARGIDVPDVACVIHAEVPTSPDDYTHRAGRTGRAGRKGRSAVLVTPAQINMALRILRLARVTPRFEPVPSAAAIRDAADRRLAASITAIANTETPADPRAIALARLLLEGAPAERIVAALLTQDADRSAPEPRDLEALAPPQPTSERSPRSQRMAPRAGAPDAFVSFRIAWGAKQGADPRRLLAMVCRRGQIRGRDVGAIRIDKNHSVFDVAPSVARGFATRAMRADSDPEDSIAIVPFGESGPAPARHKDRGPRDRHPAKHQSSPPPPKAFAMRGRAAPSSSRP